MNRSDLTGQLASRFRQFTRQDVDLSLKAILDAIAKHLAGNGKVEIRGFGSFRLNVRPARNARNPKTGEKVAVPEKVVPHFKPGLELKRRVNQVR